MVNLLLKTLSTYRPMNNLKAPIHIEGCTSQADTRRLRIDTCGTQCECADPVQFKT